MQMNNTAFPQASSVPGLDDSASDVSRDLDVYEAIAEHIESPQSTWKPIALDAEILAVFAQTPADGESRAQTFTRKEHHLALLFAQLVPAESLALEQRLRLAKPDDPIAAQFGRLVATRQARLLAHLAASRKRHPLQIARGTGG